MPLITVKTSGIHIENETKFLNQISNELANLTGKPQSYVMVILEPNCKIIFAGEIKPACFIEVKSIGAINPPLMTESFSRIVSDLLKIPMNRIYIAFEDVKASQWGFNGKTFG